MGAPFPRRSPAATAHPADRPYRLIVTDDPCKTLAQGEVRYFASMLEAGNGISRRESSRELLPQPDGFVGLGERLEHLAAS